MVISTRCKAQRKVQKQDVKVLRYAKQGAAIPVKNRLNNFEMLNDVKMYCVVQLKCVGVILLSYRRDKQMRVGSRAPTVLRTCCETKRDFRNICCRRCCWPGKHRHSMQANDQNPPKIAPHPREQPKTQMHSRLVWKI